jgi:hypothetical protein
MVSLKEVVSKVEEARVKKVNEQFNRKALFFLERSRSMMVFGAQRSSK